MNKPLEDFQKLGQTNMDATMRMFGEWTKSWQAIAAEMTDYSKRSYQEGTQALEKLMTAKTVEQALQIQSSYAKRAYEDYVGQMNKLGGMYSELAKETMRPFEKLAGGAVR